MTVRGSLEVHRTTMRKLKYPVIGMIIAVALVAAMELFKFTIGGMTIPEGKEAELKTLLVFELVMVAAGGAFAGWVYSTIPKKK